MDIVHYKKKISSFFVQEKYQEAIEYTENLLISNSNNNLLKIYLGLAYFCLENEELYQTILLDLLFNSSEEELTIVSENVFNIADLKFNQKNTDLAIKLYQQGLEIDAQYIPAYINLAELYTQQSNFDSAVFLWQELIFLQPNLIISYKNLGLLWQNIYEYEKAITIYQQGLNIEEHNLFILSNLAYCYLKTNQIFYAKELLLKMIKIEPNIYEVYGELGYIYLLENNIHVAVESWQKLINHQHLIFQQYFNWYHKDIKNLPINNETIPLNINLINSLINNENIEQICINIANIFFQQKNYLFAINYYQIALNNNRESESIYENFILSLFYTNNIEVLKNYLHKIDNINLQKSQILINLINKKLLDNKKEENLLPSPENYYETPDDWLEKQSLSNNYYYEFNLDNILVLKLPKSLNNKIHPSFYFPSKITLPKTFLVNIPDGHFYLREDEASSAIITKENYLIGNLSPESPALSPNHPDSHPSKHSLFRNKFLPPIKYIKGTVIILAGLANNIYFHWLFDILPRINLLELTNIDYNNIDYILVDNRTNFQKETLEIFGIPSHKILPLSFPLHLQATNLIIPSFPSAIAWMPSWSCNYLKNKILDNQETKYQNKKRLYISRKKSNNRRLINEEEIINILSNYNFEIIELELISVKKQAELLSQAEIVISPHGSGLSNIVFCQPNTKIIEIFAPNYVYPCYWLVSNLNHLDYFYLLGETIGSKHFHQLLYPDARLEDIYLNSQNLAELLSQIITSLH